MSRGDIVYRINMFKPHGLLICITNSCMYVASRQSFEHIQVMVQNEIKKIDQGHT